MTGASLGFRRATKAAAKLRLALAGPAGSGKTYSALRIGTALAGTSRVALVDTEHGSASKYADEFDFDTMELESFHPQNYIDAIDAAEEAGYGVIILDSLSHAWMGKDGALDLVDKAAKRSQSGNSYMAWKDVTPLQNAMIDRIISAKIHVIATLRVKTEYVIMENDKGKKEPKKIGLQPVQRDQVEYEFDVYCDLNQNNELMVGKTRCPAIAGAVIAKPGKEFADMLLAWLSDEVKSEDDRLYKRWITIADEAKALNISVPKVETPVGRAELTRLGTDTVAKIRVAKQAQTKADGEVNAFLAQRQAQQPESGAADINASEDDAAF